MHRCALCRCADGRCHFTCQVLWSVAGSRTHSTCQSQLTYGNVASSVWHGEQSMRCMVSVHEPLLVLSLAWLHAWAQEARRTRMGAGGKPQSGGGGIFKTAAVGVLRLERRLMTTGEITK